MEAYLAYLDESGGHGFDFTKEGTTTHFVICAILIDQQTEVATSSMFEKIKSKYYPDSELKSNKVGNKENLRLRIIKDFVLTPYKLDSFFKTV